MNLEKVFNFIKDKRGYNAPFMYKLYNDIPFDKDDLFIKGDLYLSGRNSLPTLPDNLTVTQDFFLISTNLNSLPNNLTVGGSLSCSNTSLSEIPNKLTVHETFFIRKTPLSRKYNDEQINQMIKDKGGSVGNLVM